MCGHSIYGSLTELILDGEIATLDEESPFSGSIERVVITEKCKELPPYLFYGLSIGSIEIIPRETPLYIGACALTTAILGLLGRFLVMRESCCVRTRLMERIFPWQLG